MADADGQQSWWRRKFRLLGIAPAAVPAEQGIATLGAILAIALTVLITDALAGPSVVVAIVPSMGAATVLLFAAPHGPLSQPWALLMGNGISAVIGVACYQLLGDTAMAAGLAVGLAVAAMHLSRSLHPPGGATALAAVIGGEPLHALGYQYLVVPVLLNCLVLLAVALVFNNLFGWRRYPAALMRRSYSAPPAANTLDTRHIRKAIHDLQVFVDIEPEQLRQVYEHAQSLVRQEKAHRLTITPGGFYTNSRPGWEWSVRQVVDESPHPDPRKHMIIYRIIEGRGMRSSGSCSLDEFVDWAAQRLQPKSDL